ncbi:MAG: 3-deoxy-manno-octulosonate cytidylyltransferase [Planctomycetales bacterium]
MIPARLASTRLPGKLLLDSTGRPLLSYAIDRAIAALRQSPSFFRDVYVVADDESLCRIAEQYGVKSIASRSAHVNGTSRIAAAVRELKGSAEFDFVVNLQGDHPQVAPDAILRVANALVEHSSADMSTAAVPIDANDRETLECRNVVKVWMNQATQATAFSRSTRQLNLDQESAELQSAHRHVGIYAYRVDFLETYARLPPSPGELREDLEQLRALEHRADIRVVTIPGAMAGPGIDTAEEYASFVRSVMSPPGARSSVESDS